MTEHTAELLTRLEEFKAPLLLAVCERRGQPYTPAAAPMIWQALTDTAHAMKDPRREKSTYGGLELDCYEVLNGFTMDAPPALSAIEEAPEIPEAPEPKKGKVK